jgi:two-component system chemotaxis response regulator CheY
LDEALSAARAGACHLMLVNRKLDRDYSDGIEIIHAVRADRGLDHLPVMMVTNFEQHQQLAVEAGAEYGFGKRALGSPETLERLRKHLA